MPDRGTRIVPRLLDQVDWSDPFSYVRVMYGVPARLGGQVRFRGNEGEIVGAEGHYLLVQIKGAEHEHIPIMVHPTWEMTYVD